MGAQRFRRRARGGAAADIMARPGDRRRFESAPGGGGEGERVSIECPRCASHNAEGALHCDQCGAPLYVGAGGRSPRRGAAGAIATVLIAGLVAGSGFLWWKERHGAPADSDRRTAGAGDREGSRSRDRRRPHSRNGESRGNAADGSAAGRGAAQVIAGWLQLEDPRGAVLSRIPVAVSREGWLALPRRMALGASRFVFRPGQGGEAEVVDGVWRRGEPVGLWRIETHDLAGAPPLEAWREGDAAQGRGAGAGGASAALDMLLYSYAGGEGVAIDAPSALRAEGLFLRGAAEVDLGRGGALVQGGALVGWCFAGTSEEEATAEMWLWSGASGADLEPERTVADHYAETFAGGREEALAAAHALAEGDAPRARVLLAFGDALERRALLPPEDCRERWLPSGAAGVMARLMRQLLDDGAPGAILSALDESVLALLADGDVLILYADALAALEGPEAALAFIDRRGAWLPAGGEHDEPLESRQRRWFAEAVVRALDAGDPTGAWDFLEDGRRRFPDDAALLLTEAELWLDEGDWRRAEALLAGVSFPGALRDRAALLENRISELRGAEGKIVIRFRPGAPSITTHADITGVQQLFIVDTGASFTSIPWSTVRALGIPIDASTPRRELRTASDVILAPVVTLPAITLGGWTIPEVEATVIDLPGHDEVGLLGLNFLGAFRVDLDRTRGLLTLEPK